MGQIGLMRHDLTFVYLRNTRQCESHWNGLGAFDRSQWIGCNLFGKVLKIFRVLRVNLKNYISRITDKITYFVTANHLEMSFLGQIARLMKFRVNIRVNFEWISSELRVNFEWTSRELRGNFAWGTGLWASKKKKFSKKITIKKFQRSIVQSSKQKFFKTKL